MAALCRPRLASAKFRCHNSDAKSRSDAMPIYALEDARPELPPEGDYWIARTRW